MTSCITCRQRLSRRLPSPPGWSGGSAVRAGDREKRHNFYVRLWPAIPRQKLLSTPRHETLAAHLSEGFLLRRSGFFTDTAIGQSGPRPRNSSRHHPEEAVCRPHFRRARSLGNPFQEVVARKSSLPTSSRVNYPRSARGSLESWALEGPKQRDSETCGGRASAARREPRRAGEAFQCIAYLLKYLARQVGQGGHPSRRELRGSHGVGVVNNNWLDCVLLSTLYMFKPSC